MADLNALIVFAKVVEANGFSSAARQLKMPVSTVSRKVAELENQLGVRLLERSTRNLRLTDIGGEVLDQAQRGADISDSVESIISNQFAVVKGVLRVSAPPNISDSLLAPLVSAFQAEHPDVRVQIMITDRSVDHVSEGIDVAFRVGRLKDSALVARTILRYRHLLVASPAYLQDRPTPLRPKDLLDHRLLAFSFGAIEHSWTFVGNGKRETIRFLPSISMNDFSGLAAAMVSGCGVGVLPPVMSPALVRDGILVEVMPNWTFPPIDLSIVRLGSRHQSRAVRLFIDFAAHMTPQLFEKMPI